MRRALDSRPYCGEVGDHVALGEDPQRLDRDELGVAGPDADAEQSSDTTRVVAVVAGRSGSWMLIRRPTPGR